MYLGNLENDDQAGAALVGPLSAIHEFQSKLLLGDQLSQPLAIALSILIQNT